MRMKPEHFDKLAAKTCQVLSPRTRLIVTRRVLREVLAQDDREKSILRMAIRQLKRNLPFSKSKLAEVEQLLSDCQKANRELLIGYGQILRDYRHGLETAMTFDQLCEVLGVNPVHRQEVKEDGDGLLAITWIGGQFEDSATHYGKDGATGAGPVTRAIGAAMQDFMLKNMDLMPDPFAPGGPFHGVPTYYRQPDGSMARKSASLTVHDADGSSRVVERRVEKVNG
ncbi:hypothetical protein [Pseudomonas fluorescens]|uniref:Uncharacterized protein n=1 Tax=Pseudomonas fluorescens TaxID=294 RepID=A0A5E7ECP8_PSEFL|nr:hypothetical protein [Pseudomonas fluorescens]VVO24504.1 hypothetical protein PS710_04514 [Pseudomonas fluorescens]